MKRILVFNDYYIPAVKCGGPVTSIRNVVMALSDEFEFYIEAANHDFGDNQPFLNIGSEWYKVGPAHVRYHRDGELDFNLKNIEVFIKEVKPDIMWFSGLLVPNKIHNAIRVGEKIGIPVVISPRGEASPDRMCLKGYKKYPYAALVSLLGIYRKKNVFFHTTSDDEIVGLKKYFHINEKRIFEVPNIGVVASKRSNQTKTSGEVKIMFISRIHEVKNLHLAIQAVNRMKSSAVFDIYGPIESEEYWKVCKNEMKNSPENVRINYCGKVNPNEVGEVYQKYDCFLFPTLNENYGHVIAEALANGCQVILSKGTTPWDDLDTKAGFVCDLNKLEQFTEALEKIADESNEDYGVAISKVYKYYHEKNSADNAILGHKKMFNTVIGICDELYGR